MNNKNLITFKDRTPEERRELGRIGGIKSGEARRKKHDAIEAQKLKDGYDKSVFVEALYVMKRFPIEEMRVLIEYNRQLEYLERYYPRGITQEQIEALYQRADRINEITQSRLEIAQRHKMI